MHCLPALAPFSGCSTSCPARPPRHAHTVRRGDLHHGTEVSGSGSVLARGSTCRTDHVVAQVSEASPRARPAGRGECDTAITSTGASARRTSRVGGADQDWSRPGRDRAPTHWIGHVQHPQRGPGVGSRSFFRVGSTDSLPVLLGVVGSEWSAGQARGLDNLVPVGYWCRGASPWRPSTMSPPPVVPPGTNACARRQRRWTGFLSLRRSR